jgi:uncharacterized Zn finger protein (UPF0148 family)
MKRKVYCPNCDYRLEIVEEGAAYAIVDGDHAVTSCPNCLVALAVEDGELKVDDE